MIKNVALKKALKGSIFKCITLLNRIIPKDDSIILLHMGNKGIGFNLEPLLDYLLENRYNEKYKIVCSVESKKYFGHTSENIKYVTHGKGMLAFVKAKHVFYTAGQIPIKPSNKQIVIHMNHGITDYKTVGALTNINNGDEFFFTYMIASSPVYVPIIEKEYLCKKDNIKICNEPMVERILKPKCKYDFSGYSKVLLWLPTFRQSDYLGYSDSSVEELLPLFTEEQYVELNEILKNKNILLLVKLHPSQSVDKYKQIKFSNLSIYSHEDFINSKMNLYDLMAQVDGLIGDYSSASLQFLLTEKPVAYVIPDFDEYKEKRGFVFENAKDYMPGHLIYSIQDFIDFIEDFSGERDIYKEKRIQVENLVHTYKDDKSCQRLLEMSEIYK